MKTHISSTPPNTCLVSRISEISRDDLKMQLERITENLQDASINAWSTTVTVLSGLKIVTTKSFSTINKIWWLLIKHQKPP